MGALSRPYPRYLSISGCQLPYVVFDNADDVTTRRGAALGNRLEQSLQALWKLYLYRPL